MRLLQGLEKWPRLSVLLAGFLSTLAIAVVDYFTGYELSLSVFYLIPVSLIAWAAGRWEGLSGAFLAALVWTAVDVLAGETYTGRFFIFWHVVTRAGVLCTVALLFSSLRKSVEHERALARIDHLTGAANARSFLEILASETDRSRRYKRPFTLAYFDLDNFKAVNDSFGHATGDLVLKTAVATVRKLVRSTDVIARLGGDEFALLLPETDQNAAVSALVKMRDGLILEMGRSGWRVTVSFGVLTVTGTQLGVDELLKQVDNLMYGAKMKGKNAMSFFPAVEIESDRVPRRNAL